MKTNKRNVMFLVVAIFMITTLTISAVGIGILNWDFRSGTSSDYKINENGLTYGSAAFSTSYEEEPDLIGAVGVDGTIGYVYKEDLRGPQPKTPEEAVALMTSLDRNGGIRSIPLYKEDGKTVIGEFIIGGGERKEWTEATKEEESPSR